jgi:hypothetical protein
MRRRFCYPPAGRAVETRCLPRGQHDLARARKGALRYSLTPLFRLEPPRSAPRTSGGEPRHYKAHPTEAGRKAPSCFIGADVTFKGTIVHIHRPLTRGTNTCRAKRLPLSPGSSRFCAGSAGEPCLRRAFHQLSNVSEPHSNLTYLPSLTCGLGRQRPS